MDDGGPQIAAKIKLPEIHEEKLKWGAGGAELTLIH
jgi:hypothetical protein